MIVVRPFPSPETSERASENEALRIEKKKEEKKKGNSLQELLFTDNFTKIHYSWNPNS